MTDVAWIVSAYPWPGQPIGGVFYQTQARAISQLGLAITVASPTPWAPWPITRLDARWRAYANAPRHATDDGIAVIRPRYPAVPGEPRWALPDRMIARSVWRAGAAWAGARVIHGHSAITGLAAWRLARRARLPFVLTFHGSDLNTWPLDRPDRIGDLRRAMREAAAVITVSEALAERAEQLAGVRAIHLPVGSDHRRLRDGAVPRAEARRLLGLPDDRIVALFVGNLLPAKGVRELAEAVLARSDRFVGLFVGDGPLRGHGLAEGGDLGALLYRGARPHEEVARYMSAADVLVLPSQREGLPTVLVEAGSLGLPVIASAVGGIPSLLGDDRGRVIAEVSADAVGEALDSFANDRLDASARAGRLRAFVLANHDVEANARRLVELYRSIGAADTRTRP